MQLEVAPNNNTGNNTNGSSLVLYSSAVCLVATANVHNDEKRPPFDFLAGM
jgi:hypothetical protein